MKPALVKLLILGATLWVGCRSAPGMTGRDHDITASDMRARIEFLASDALRGRATPSRGLDIAAEYIAVEYRRMGLRPPPGGFIQRYRLARTDMGDGWTLAIRSGRRSVRPSLGSDFWGVPWAGGTVEGPIRFMGGQPPAATTDGVAPAIWLARISPSVTSRDWLRAASDAGASGLLLVFSRGMGYQVDEWLVSGQSVYELGDLEPSLPAALISEEALASAVERLGLEAQFASIGREEERGLRATLSADMRVETTAAPNVVGILPGSDPSLRDEYVIVSAHMDHLGVGFPVDGDSIYNGADDNASGTAAMLEIAEAAAALAKRPKRSLVFLAVSGEEKGLLGSTWFVTYPPIPLDRAIANLNIDMIGRNWEDTIAVIGKPYSTLGSLVDSVAAVHPELNVTAVGDPWPAERFFWRSDQFNFARKGIPSIFFFNGVHPDYHRPSDELEKINVEKASRITRLIFMVAVAVANAESPPRWDPRAEAAIVERSR
ncbi:MAG: M20/M25/M40 family metallo-hydrolase [Candidatus Palauibacterales bacterium]|nr:M20/M25/M40 family metallo-hydrolase [Candidatus Palauibacterales bacterium]